MSREESPPNDDEDRAPRRRIGALPISSLLAPHAEDTRRHEKGVLGEGERQVMGGRGGGASWDGERQPGDQVTSLREGHERAGHGRREDTAGKEATFVENHHRQERPSRPPAAHASSHGLPALPSHYPPHSRPPLGPAFTPHRPGYQYAAQPSHHRAQIYGHTNEQDRQGYPTRPGMRLQLPPLPTGVRSHPSSSETSPSRDPRDPRNFTMTPSHSPLDDSFSRLLATSPNPPFRPSPSTSPVASSSKSVHSHYGYFNLPPASYSPGTAGPSSAPAAPGGSSFGGRPFFSPPRRNAGEKRKRAPSFSTLINPREHKKVASEAPGQWTATKRLILVDRLITAGYKALDLAAIADELGLKKKQIVNQLTPNRTGSIRERLMKAALVERGERAPLGLSLGGKGKGREDPDEDELEDIEEEQEESD